MSCAPEISAIILALDQGLQRKAMHHHDQQQIDDILFHEKLLPTQIKKIN
jgi:hypothetical protein